MEDTQIFIKENWENTSVFVAIGGDGTILSIARELLFSDKILAAIPMGSGNGFARETGFHIPFSDLITKLQNPNFRLIDTLLINNTLSINVSGIGLDSQIVKKFEKTSRGFANYIKLSIQTFFEKPRIKIEFEQQWKAYNGEYLMMNIANTKQFGNNAYIAPLAKDNDALMDVVLIKAFPISYSLKFVYRMFQKKLKNDAYYYHFSCAELKLKINSKDWHIDGEYLEMEEQSELKILPKSLKILV